VVASVCGVCGAWGKCGVRACVWQRQRAGMQVRAVCVRVGCVRSVQGVRSGNAGHVCCVS